MANPVVQSSTKATGASTTSVAPAKPSGLAEGDLMLASVGLYDATNDGRTISTPSGWTLVTSGTSGGTSPTRCAIFTKIATSGDVAASTFTFSVSGTVSYLSAVLARIDGQAEITINVSESDGNTTATTTPSFTTALTPDTTTNSLLVMSFIGSAPSPAATPTVSAYASTPSATWTEIQDAGLRSGDGMSHGVAWADYDSNTEITARTATFSDTSGKNCGSMVVVRGTIDASVTLPFDTVEVTNYNESLTTSSSVTLPIDTVNVTDYDPTVVAMEVTKWSNEDKPSTTWFNQDK